MVRLGVVPAGCEGIMFSCFNSNMVRLGAVTAPAKVAAPVFQFQYGSIGGKTAKNGKDE